MNKGKLIKITIFILLAAGLLQAGITTYSAIADQILEKNTQETAYAETQNAVGADIAVQEVEIPKEAIDISGVVLKKEVEDKITSFDAANADNNIRNYKTLLVALGVPESFQLRIEEMYIKNHKVPDVLAAYDFLYQNYGSTSELEGLITLKESGKAWNTIFKEYTGSKGKFQPTNFENGKLEQVFKIPGITPDDIVIADRTAQKSGMKFDELIAMRSQGLNWKAINESLDIVNTSDKLPRAAVTSAEVNKYMRGTGLSEAKVIEALVLAQRLDRDRDAIIEKIKAGYVEEDIIAESLEKKYQ